MDKFSQEFKSLQNMSGFNTVVKNINSASNKEQAEDHFYLLRIGKSLQETPDLKLNAFEDGKPPRDIVFEYQNIPYAVEVKILRKFNRAKEVNKPPYRINLDDYLDANRNLKCELPKELARLDYKYDYKEIIDIINEVHGRQLDKKRVNIIILISKAGWLGKEDIEDVWNYLFVKKSEQYPLLTALIFCDVTTQNYIFQNPQVSNIDKVLKSHIKACKF